MLLPFFFISSVILLIAACRLFRCERKFLDDNEIDERILLLLLLLLLLRRVGLRARCVCRQRTFLDRKHDWKHDCVFVWRPDLFQSTIN